VNHERAIGPREGSALRSKSCSYAVLFLALADGSPAMEPASTGVFVVKETDGRSFSLQAGGRLHLDAAAYQNDEGTLEDGTTARRARLYLAGTVAKHWEFKGEYDFAGTATRVTDAFVRHKGGSAHWTIGHFKVPFSLENAMSTNDIAFIERSLAVDALTPALRRIGLSVNTAGNRWGVTGGVFGSSIQGDFENRLDSGVSAGARATMAPRFTDRAFVHMATSFEHREIPGKEQLRLGRGAESTVADRFLVDTGDIDDADRFNRLGGEFALINGPWSLQAEYLTLGIDRETAADPWFHGGYVQAGWFVTGESRPYDAAKGSFSRPRPEHKFGALELAWRLSHIDLNDASVSGGEADLFGAAMNYYANDNFRLSIDVIDTLALSSRSGASAKPTVYTARFQAAY
jgi:phosphate-selective porin OprO and OprP